MSSQSAISLLRIGYLTFMLNTCAFAQADQLCVSLHGHENCAMSTQLHVEHQKLDKQLNAAYRKQFTQLTADQQMQLRSRQRAWLREPVPEVWTPKKVVAGLFTQHD
jgi:uncharacterized protein YecT (DUF1311 family)